MLRERLTKLARAFHARFGVHKIATPPGGISKPAPPSIAWSQEAFVRARHALEALPEDQWTVDNYMLAAESILRRYLPAGVIVTEADYSRVRVALMAPIGASMDGSRERRAVMQAELAAAIAALLPTPFRKVPDQPPRSGPGKMLVGHGHAALAGACGA
jgi:hypothetical protein